MLMNGRVAVSGAVVRMSVGTIPYREWRLAFDVHCFTFRIDCEPGPACPSCAARRQLLAVRGDGVRPSESSESASAPTLPRLGTASPLLHACSRLPMTTASGHSSPWNLH